MTRCIGPRRDRVGGAGIWPLCLSLIDMPTVARDLPHRP